MDRFPMRIPTLTELTLLTAEAAVQRFYDGLNYRALGWVLALISPTALVGILLSAGTDWWRAGAAACVAAFIAGVLAIRHTVFFAENARSILIVVLATVGVASALSLPIGIPGALLSGVGFPVALLFFRLKVVERFGLLALFAAAAIWLVLRIDPQEGSPVAAAMSTLVGVVGIASLALGTQLTRRQEQEFLETWHLEVTRNREQRRMSSELHDAREIQLGMLPAATLALPWLDFSAVSIPASEVGGDYYDYFVLDDDRAVVVVGDVSGHGMSSGLVLAAVRAGLHLLRESLDRPVEALIRLDTMLRATTPGRMFVSLQLALIDRSRREIRVANAGHPPVLFLTERGSEALGAPGKPLGTRLEGEFGEQRVAFQPGDVLVFYTDGVTELRNFRGQAFGFDRIEREASRRRPERGAKAIRDRLLSSLTHYRSDVEQADDVTLVVVTLEPGGGG